MGALASLLSHSGRLAPNEFARLAGAVYLAGLLSHLLLTAPVVTGSLWLAPYVLAQAGLLWAWHAVHARRLDDAGRRRWPALTVALAYAVSVLGLVGVALLVSLAAASEASFVDFWNASGAVTLTQVLFLGLWQAISVWPMPPWELFGIFGSLALLLYGPSLLAIGFSAWAYAQPPAPSPPAAAPKLAAAA